MDAGFVWTEPHSKRVKVKLTIQKEVGQMNNMVWPNTMRLIYIEILTLHERALINQSQADGNFIQLNCTCVYVVMYENLS